MHPESPAARSRRTTSRRQRLVRKWIMIGVWSNGRGGATADGTALRDRYSGFGGLVLPVGSGDAKDVRGAHASHRVVGCPGAITGSAAGVAVRVKSVDIRTNQGYDASRDCAMNRPQTRYRPLLIYIAVPR